MRERFSCDLAPAASSEKADGTLVSAPMTGPDPRKRRWGLALLLLSAANAFPLAIWWRWMPRLPDRQEAESRIESVVGLREETAVVATCSEPTENGFGCRLRDGRGRLGWSSTFFTTERGGGEELDRLHQFTSWDFPLGPDGVLIATFDQAAQAGLSLPAWIFGTILVASRCFEPAGQLPSVDCPAVPVGGAAACSTSGRVKTAGLRRLDADRYELTLSFALDGAA